MKINFKVKVGVQYNFMYERYNFMYEIFRLRYIIKFYFVL